MADFFLADTTRVCEEGGYEEDKGLWVGVGYAHGGGQKSAQKEIRVFKKNLLKGTWRKRGFKKNQKWTQCELRVEGVASSKDDRKTILWPC